MRYIIVYLSLFDESLTQPKEIQKATSAAREGERGRECKISSDQ